MASRVVQPPQPSRIPVLYLVVGALLFAAALGASFGFGSSARVEIDGTVRRVAFGTTIGDLEAKGKLAHHDGDLLSAVDRHVTRRGQGGQLRVLRNGEPVSSSAVVFDGDVVTSIAGADRVERTVTITRPIEMTTTVEGQGPLMSLASPGSVGVMRLTVGAVSGDEVTSTVVTPATPMIVRRHGVSPGEPVVSLTFDDGPWPGQTERILDILREQGVKASFFMLGYKARDNPALAKRVADEGHVVGSHTMGHKTLTRLDPGLVAPQIVAGQDAVAAATGVQPHWFRPPGGQISPDVWNRVNEANLRVAMWNVDPQDWRRPNADWIARYIVNHVTPGSIVLLHDGGGDRSMTIVALPWIIGELKARGYRFVTLDELAGLGGS